MRRRPHRPEKPPSAHCRSPEARSQRTRKAGLACGGLASPPEGMADDARLTQKPGPLQNRDPMRNAEELRVVAGSATAEEAETRRGAATRAAPAGCAATCGLGREDGAAGRVRARPRSPLLQPRVPEGRLGVANVRARDTTPMCKGFRHALQLPQPAPRVERPPQPLGRGDASASPTGRHEYAVALVAHGRREQLAES